MKSINFIGPTKNFSGYVANDKIALNKVSLICSELPIKKVREERIIKTDPKNTAPKIEKYVNKNKLKGLNGIKTRKMI